MESRGQFSARAEYQGDEAWLLTVEVGPLQHQTLVHGPLSGVARTAQRLKDDLMINLECALPSGDDRRWLQAHMDREIPVSRVFASVW